MDGRALEDAALLAAVLPELEVFHLKDDAEALQEEDATEDGQQQFLVDNNGQDGDDAANGQATRVAHKYLGGIGVVPEETDERTDGSANEDDQFLRARDIHNIEVTGIFYMTADIRQDTQGDTDDGTVASRHSVHSVVEVGTIRHGCNDQHGHEYHQEDTTHGFVVAHEGHDFGVVKVVVLDKGNGGFGGLDGLAFVDHFHAGLAAARDFHVLADYGIGTKIKRQAHDETNDHLPEYLIATCKSFLVLAEYLDVVIEEAQGSEPYGCDNHQYHIDIAQTPQEQTGHENGHDNNDATH